MHFILVHGAYHGGWCWSKLVPLLQRAGHSVDAPDLPGMGESHAPPASMTLDTWAEFVAERVRAAPSPPILVGHSRGGLVISQAAERVATRLHGLVYLTAVLLPDGASINDQRGDAAAALPGGTARIIDQGDGTKLLDPEDVVPFFYHRSTKADQQRAIASLCPEPTAIYDARLSLSADRWGAVRRAYIECGDDRILALPVQRAAHGRLPCDPIITLDSDHSPFFCVPDALADALDDIARGWSGPAPD